MSNAVDTNGSLAGSGPYEAAGDAPPHAWAQALAEARREDGREEVAGGAAGAHGVHAPAHAGRHVHHAAHAHHSAHAHHAAHTYHAADAAAHRERVRQAVGYFEGQGWTHAQAVGIVANLDAESGLDAHRNQNGGGPGYGVGQWEAPRQHDFQAWAGHDIQHSTYEEQLRFVQHELTNGSQSGAGRALHRETTAGGSAASVTRHYERPRDTEGEAVRRADRARQIEGQLAH
jgi:hypothetical protein